MNQLYQRNSLVGNYGFSNIYDLCWRIMRPLYGPIREIIFHARESGKGGFYLEGPASYCGFPDALGTGQ